MKRDRIMPEDLAPAIGAYSHGYAVEIGGARLIFVTGQIAVGTDGNVVSEDVAIQTRFVLERIASILSAAGASMADVVKVQIFLTDIGDFSVVSPVRNEFLGDARPVSTLVEVSSLVNPGCKVEIEVMAVAG